MSKQIPFALPVEPAMGEDDFLITPGNEEAAKLVKATGPADLLLLLGPTSSGKSHLARIWAEKRTAATLNFAAFSPDSVKEGAYLLWEDADKTGWNPEAEKKAFHLLNSVREKKTSLLITATEAPASWNITLADLRSRLLALPVAQIHTPDDILVAGLLVKHLNDRQLKVSEEVIDYLIPRLPREGAKIAAAVRALDEAALAGQRAITVPLVKQIFSETLALDF